MAVFGYERERPIDRLSLCSCQVSIRYQKIEIGIGTGFFIHFEDDEIYFATNWHNVTGRHPVTHKTILDPRAIPDELIVNCLLEDKNPSPGGGQRIKLNLSLYKDEERFEPTWKEHAAYAEQVDAVLIPIPKILRDSLPKNHQLFCLEMGDPEILITAGMDVVILGYPEGVSGSDFPIWKRGSIASEPYCRVDDLPKFYVDSATRRGMSGSPVYAVASGSIRYENNPYVGQGGPVKRFLGIYSGRVGVGDDAFAAQLGIVWKESVTAEIAGFGVQGQSSEMLSPKA